MEVREGRSGGAVGSASGIASRVSRSAMYPSSGVAEASSRRASSSSRRSHARRSRTSPSLCMASSILARHAGVRRTPRAGRPARMSPHLRQPTEYPYLIRSESRMYTCFGPSRALASGAGREGSCSRGGRTAGGSELSSGAGSSHGAASTACGSSVRLNRRTFHHDDVPPHLVASIRHGEVCWNGHLLLHGKHHVNVCIERFTALVLWRRAQHRADEARALAGAVKAEGLAAVTLLAAVSASLQRRRAPCGLQARQRRRRWERAPWLGASL